MNANNKSKYIIKSKVRFTLFLAIMILIMVTTVTSVFGLDTVNSASLNQYNQVTVQSGDTIWNIAKSYVSKDKDLREIVYDICELNDIQADELEVGQDIIIPVYS